MCAHLEDASHILHSGNVGLKCVTKVKGYLSPGIAAAISASFLQRSRLRIPISISLH